jgi:hypothetical protein
MSYVMTPARRAALRKAQLISAQRRRKHGAVHSVLHSARQRAGVAYNEGKLQHYRTHEHREALGQKTKALPRKAAKTALKKSLKTGAKAAIGAGLTIGAATAIGYTASGMVSGRSHKSIGGRPIRHVKSTRGVGMPLHQTRAITARKVRR